jgi:hypothetical protein
LVLARTGLEEFNLAAGIKAVHVHTEPSEAIADVVANTLAGRVTYMMSPIQFALADIRVGKLVALGVTTKKRSSLLPKCRPLRRLALLVMIFQFGTVYGYLLELPPTS